MGERKIRFGVIGTGLMGRLHAENLAFRIDGAELATVCDIDRIAGEECAARCGIEAAYENYGRLLSHPDLDAVAICTPPETHGAIVEEAAKAGKHVFCEKPLDSSLAAIDRALKAVETAGVKLHVGFNRRYDNGFRQVREVVAGGRIGTPLTLQIISRDPVREADETGTFVPEMFLDTTIHDFDMARFIMGDEIVSVSAFGLGARREESEHGPHTAVTILRFTGGAIGTIDNSWLSPYGYDQRLEVFGPAGVARVENADADALGGETAAAFFVQRYFDSYVAEMSAFVECVLEGREPPVSGAEGRAAVVLAMAAQRSCREGRPVAVEEVG
jgi:myo-inositol 2-dehydrogenase/D-chiro-inositol 1-dehydrogenase